MKFIRELILEGKIPRFRTIKLIALVLSFLPIPVFFLAKVSPRDYAELGWNFLIGIMLIRPLADVFPGIRILRSLVPFRKEFGIAAAWFMVLHSYGAFAAQGKNLLAVFDAKYWHLNHPLLWGILGFFCVLLLLFTSNMFSMKLLKQNWKRVQRLSYPLFFFVAVHIALISGRWSKVMVPVLAVMILWTLAKLKIKVPLFVKSEPDVISELNSK